MVKDYICVDVEATGTNPKLEKIIEIGAVKVINGQVTDTFQTLINPGRLLDSRIVELTGITDEMLSNAPLIREVLSKFYLFCENLPLLGQNLIFDYSFLKRAMVNEGLSFERKGVDTLRIARTYLPELESRKLESLCKYFNIKHTAHRALGDADATHQLYGKLCELFVQKAEEQNCRVFEPSELIYKVKKEQSITIAQKEQVAKYCARLNISLNLDLNLMTRAEASRFIERHRLAYKALE